MLVHFRAFPSHDVREVRCEDKRCALAFDTEFLFEIAQEMAKVDMEQMSRPCDLRNKTKVTMTSKRRTGAMHHDVVVVAVSNA